MERKILGIRWDEKMTNREKIRRMGAQDTGYIIKNLKWKFAGHVAQEQGEKWNKIILNWGPYENKWHRGRSSQRWADKLRTGNGTV